MSIRHVPASAVARNMDRKSFSQTWYLEPRDVPAVSLNSPQKVKIQWHKGEGKVGTKAENNNNSNDTTYDGKGSENMYVYVYV